MFSFKDKTYFISGASRGIGKAIALKLASEGANIIIAAKSVSEQPNLEGTIYTAAKEIELAGGKAFPIACDIRDEEQIITAFKSGVANFGSLHGIINNASAISLTNTEQTSVKKFDLMHDINVRGTFLVTKHGIPYLKQSGGGHILTLSPPIDLQPKWFKDSLPYTLSKFNMTLLAMGWAAELKKDTIAANSLWPMTTIATAAVNNLLGGDYLMKRSRKPEIVADAVHFILQQDPSIYTGQQLLDETVLQQAGITDFSSYAVVPGGELQKDLFLD